MDLDLNDPRVFLRQDVVDDPRPFYDRLRRDAPVWRIPGQDSYLVSDPALIRDAVGRTSEFSSNLVHLLHRDDDGAPVAHEVAPYGDPIHVLATADPPAHTRHRKLLQPHLNAKSVARLQPMLLRTVDELLEPLVTAGGGDVVGALSDPLPALAICELLGLPAEDAPRLIEVVAEMSVLLDGVADPAGMGRAVAATLDLLKYVGDRLAFVRDLPRERRSGLLAVVLDAIEAEAITIDEARGILTQLFSAGTETTGSLIASTIEALARCPDFQDRLRSHPEQISDAIEEVLLNHGPFQFHYRWTTIDTRLGDTEIPAGSRVLLMWAAANRPTQAAGDEPATSDATPAAHFAFGRGLHFCIGAHLARLEARIAIERLLARTSRFYLDPVDPLRRHASIFLRRHSYLAVTLEAVGVEKVEPQMNADEG